MKAGRLALAALMTVTSAPVGAAIPPPAPHPMPPAPLSGWGPVLLDADGAPVTISEADPR